MIVSWSHLKIGSNAIAKRKPLAGQPCLTPLATRNCPRVCSSEFHVRGDVVINTTQEAADKIRQFCFLNHGEDPGMMDAGIRSSEVCQ